MHAFVVGYTLFGTTERVSSLVSTEDTEPDRLYWGFGPSYTNREWIKDQEIIRYYGEASTAREREVIRRQFQLDYPPPAVDIDLLDNAEVCGWVSPGGLLFTCSYTGHSALAVDIAASFYPSVDIDGAEYDNSDEFLYAQGWLTVRDGSPNFNCHVERSNEQLLTLQHLVDVTGRTEDTGSRPYASYIATFLNRIFQHDADGTEDIWY